MPNSLRRCLSDVSMIIVRATNSGERAWREEYLKCETLQFIFYSLLCYHFHYHSVRIIETLIEFRMCWTKNNSTIWWQRRQSAIHSFMDCWLAITYKVQIKLRIYLFVYFDRGPYEFQHRQCHANLASTEQLLQIDGYLQITFVFMFIFLNAIAVALNVFLQILFYFSEQIYAIQFCCCSKFTIRIS